MPTEKKPSFWTRLKWVFTGKPVSHEEAEAARFRPPNDPMTQTQLGARSQGTGGIGGV
jgi:hypothetical protein